MRPPIFVRTLAKEEREALEEGLRSSEAFVLRRCQILLASARGERAPQIAKNLGCGQQTVRDAIHDFNKRGLDALKALSSRPTEVHAAFDEQSARSLRELLHRSPREFGRQSTLWTLKDAAEVSGTRSASGPIGRLYPSRASCSAGHTTPYGSWEKRPSASQSSPEAVAEVGEPGRRRPYKAGSCAARSSKDAMR